jgi:RNA polymerase sigma-70 factor (ECF subfamily)
LDNGAGSYHRFLEGDISGFEEIVRMYGDKLLFFINGFIKNLTISEDLMEDTFLELLVHKRRFREDAAFKTYLFKIGRNKALNYLKRASRFRQVPIEDAENESEAMNFTESVLLWDERNRQLHSAMTKLRAEYMEVLYLLYFEEMSYEAAGRVLKKNKKQIDNLAYRGKAQLKAALEKEGYEYEES